MLIVVPLPCKRVYYVYLLQSNYVTPTLPLFFYLYIFTFVSLSFLSLPLKCWIFFNQAGPTGSQFGLLACLFVEVIQCWQMLKHPWWAIGKLVILLVFLFIVGLFPWIDNYAHLIGFIIGFLLSFALFPHVTFNVIDERGKKIGVAVCLVASAGLFIGLVIMFYVSPIYSCEYCKFFNCIPFTDTFCSSMEVKINFKDYWCGGKKLTEIYLSIPYPAGGVHQLWRTPKSGKKIMERRICWIFHLWQSAAYEATLWEEINGDMYIVTSCHVSGEDRLPSY